MSRKSDPVKQQQWVERLERFGQSGQSVAEFCRAEGVSPPSFYQWRRKLSRGAAAARPDRTHRRQLGRTTATRPAFQPVHVVPDGPAGLTVRFPSGIMAQLANDPETIEVVLKQLLHHESSGEAQPC